MEITLENVYFLMDASTREPAATPCFSVHSYYNRTGNRLQDFFAPDGAISRCKKICLACAKGKSWDRARQGTERTWSLSSGKPESVAIHYARDGVTNDDIYFAKQALAREGSH